MKKLKQIPLTKGYFASIDGDIYDNELNILKQYTNCDGYRTVGVRLADGRLTTMGVHRLLALAFIPCRRPYSSYVVNHRDLDVQNNQLTNLEWVTVSQNNIHGELFSEVSTRVNLECLSENNKVFFTGLVAASEYTGLSSLEIWDSIKNNSPVWGYHFTYIDNKTIPVELYKSGKFEKGVDRDSSFYIPKKIWIKDIESGEVKEFQSVAEAAREHNVGKPHILLSICTPTLVRLFKSGYLVSDNGAFPEISAELIELKRSSTGKSVIAYHIGCKILQRYNSASLFIKSNDLSKKDIITALKNNIIVDKGGWLFVYDNDTNLKLLNECISKLDGEVPATR